jgi:hypothetical protein
MEGCFVEQKIKRCHSNVIIFNRSNDQARIGRRVLEEEGSEVMEGKRRETEKMYTWTRKRTF